MSNQNQGYFRATEQQVIHIQTRRKKSVLLLISFVIGLMLFLFLFINTFTRADETLSKTANTMNDVGAQLGTLIGAAMMVPQIIVAGIAVIFNGVGWGTGSRGLTLTGAILYSVSAVLMIFNAPFLLPSIALSFIGYTKLKG